MDNDDTLVMPTSPESLASPDASQKIKAPIFSGKLDDKKGRDDFPEVAPGYVTRRDLLMRMGMRLQHPPTAREARARKAKARERRTPAKDAAKDEAKDKARARTARRKPTSRTPSRRARARLRKARARARARRSSPRKRWNRTISPTRMRTS